MQEATDKQAEPTLFDLLVEELTNNELQEYAVLTEKTTLVKTIEHGKWTDTLVARDLAGSGYPDKVEELRELQRKLQSRLGDKQITTSNETNAFKFLFRQEKGDKLLPFHNIKRLGSDEKITLVHVPGEVLLIDVWAAWCGLCQPSLQLYQDLLVSNSETWKGRVRVVALSIDKDEAATLERVNQRKWTSIEHLTIGAEGKYHQFCQCFGICSIPEVVLVDQEGTIVYAGHPAGWKLEQKINELLIEGHYKELLSAHLKQHPISSPDLKQNGHHPALNQSSWNRFLSLLVNLPDPRQLTNLKLITSKTRTFKDGKIETSVEPLMIRFKYEDSNYEHYESLVNCITHQLQANEYNVRSFTENRDKQLSSFYHGIRDILHSNGFESKPVIRQKRTLNVCKDSDWVVTRSIGYPNIPYDGKIPYHSVEKTIKDLSKLHGEVKEWSAAPIDALRFVSPLTIAGHKFTGIHGLHHYTSNEQASISTDCDRLQLIVSAAKHQFTERHLTHFLEFAGRHPDDVLLHILVFGEPLPLRDFLQEILQQKKPNIKLYRADRQSNHDIKIMGFESYRHTVVVNSLGMVLSCGRFEDYQGLERLFKQMNNPRPISRQFSKEFISVLDNLPQSDLYKDLQAAVRQWPYTPQLSIIINDEYSSDRLHQHERETHNASLKVAVREEHRECVEPLIKLFEGEGSVTTQYIATRDIPLGDVCITCGNQLQLPYYWYFGSNCHRCADCAQFQDKSQTPMKRYPVLENAVLVIEDRNIDVKRLGTNVQPSTEEQCREHSFECNGCSKEAGGEARYICMGCRREPNRRDFVDFCLECAKSLRSGNQEQVAKVMKNCEQDGHQPTHPLLRVLYASGYNRF